MGRWAQASRGGGGSSPLTMIIRAIKLDATDVELEYSANVDGGIIGADTFQSQPSGTVGDSLEQILPRKIEVTFDGDITADTSVLYAGTTAGILTPQTVLYT